MTPILLSAVVNENHELVVTLPDDIPVGPVELLLQPVASSPVSVAEPATERERISAKLLAGGLLVKPEDFGISPSVQPLPLEERLKIGKMPPGARPVEDLIDEDRGNR